MKTDNIKLWIETRQKSTCKSTNLYRNKNKTKNNITIN